MNPNAQQSLIRISRCLDIDCSLSLAPTQSTLEYLVSTAFKLSQDLTGDRLKDGPRRSNDHTSITDIQILPTSQEIASFRQEYPPLDNSTQHHLSGLTDLLDRQFRLLRENTVRKL